MIKSNEAHITKLIDVVKNNIRHIDYDVTVQNADIYKMILTGKDDDALFRRYYNKFATSEDPNDQKLYEQLKNVCNLILKPVCHRVYQPFNKVPSSRNKAVTLEYENDGSGTRLSELNEVLGKFWGKENVTRWFETRYMELMKSDPNAWLIIEFPSTDGTTLTQPYPYEVKARDVLYFEYLNNILQYVITRQSDNLTLYGMDSVVQFVKLDINKFPDIIQGHDNNEAKPFEYLGAQYVIIKKQLYQIIEPTPHKLGFVNAFRCGYIRDLYTDGRTYVNILDSVMPYLLNTIKASCEKDLAFMFHAFPRRYQYKRNCPNETCNNGRTPDGHTCPDCSGAGTLITTSGQEVIEIPIPFNARNEDIIDLSKLIYTDRPPVEIVELLLKYIDKLVEDCLKIIFNSDVFVTPHFDQTATGKLLDYENVNDVLYPFALDYSGKWTFAITTIAKITSKDKGLIISMLFGRDFNLETKVQLIALFREAKEAGLSSEILAYIEDRIVQAENLDSDGYMRHVVKQSLNPFQNKPVEEILYLLSAPLVPEIQKVIYSNYGYIWDMLEQRNPNDNVYLWNKTKLREALDGIATEIINNLPKQTTQNFMFREEE